jgi:hypothetical protein
MLTPMDGAETALEWIFCSLAKTELTIMVTMFSLLTLTRTLSEVLKKLAKISPFMTKEFSNSQNLLRSRRGAQSASAQSNWEERRKSALHYAAKPYADPGRITVSNQTNLTGRN